MTYSQKQFDRSLEALRQAVLSSTEIDQIRNAVGNEEDTMVEEAVKSVVHPGWVQTWGRRLTWAGLAGSVMFGGVAFASTDSLPGDMLYPVKTQIVEPLGRVVRLSDQSRFDYEVSLLQERMEEIETLQLIGEWDGDQSQQAQEMFSDQLERTQETETGDEESADLAIALDWYVEKFGNEQSGGVLVEVDNDIVSGEEVLLETTENQNVVDAVVGTSVDEVVEMIDQDASNSSSTTSVDVENEYDINNTLNIVEPVIDVPTVIENLKPQGNSDTQTGGDIPTGLPL